MKNRLSSLELKKSHSLIQRKQQSIRDHQQQITPKDNPQQSHIEQLIKQKYNFTFRVKTFNPLHKPIKKLSNNNLQNSINNCPIQLPNRSLKISLLPQIEKQQNINSSLFQNDHIKFHQSQQRKYFQKLKTKLTERQRQNNNSIFVENYCAVKVRQKRNLNEYKNCIKKIQHNTTYRGFNKQDKKSIKESKIYDKVIDFDGNDKGEKVSMSGSQNNNSQTNERRRIVNYIIERGFARRMQQSLMRIRKEKKIIHDQSLSMHSNNSKQVVINKSNSLATNKSKRSVVFSASPPIKIYQVQSQIRNVQKKQHSIDPW